MFKNYESMSWVKNMGHNALEVATVTYIDCS
jgi:hypothetical protein